MMDICADTMSVYDECFMIVVKYIRCYTALESFKYCSFADKKS